jgi:hypothetical protein
MKNMVLMVIGIGLLYGAECLRVLAIAATLSSGVGAAALVSVGVGFAMYAIVRLGGGK